MLIVHFPKSYYLCHLPLDVVQHSTNEREEEAAPTSGSRFPPGQLGLFPKVDLLTAGSSPPAFSPAVWPLSCQEAKKVTTPKNAESQSEAEQESGGGVGRETVAREEGRKGC